LTRPLLMLTDLVEREKSQKTAAGVALSKSYASDIFSHETAGR